MQKTLRNKRRKRGKSSGMTTMMMTMEGLRWKGLVTKERD